MTPGAPENPLPEVLTGAKVKLFPLAEEQLAARSQWTADNELAKLMGVDVEEEPFESAEKELENNRLWLLTRRHMGALLYGIEAEGRCIGDVDVMLMPMEKLAQFTVFIGDRSAWGKGYGTEAVALLLKALFLWEKPPIPPDALELPAETDFEPPEAVVVDVAPGNERALRFWTKLGFTEYNADEAGTKYLRLDRAAYLARPCEAAE
jgi:RimJ/RimL family protein N-acetyltransferase